MGQSILKICAAGAVIQSDPAGNRKLNNAKSYSKIDGVVTLSMALGSMSADGLSTPPVHGMIPNLNWQCSSNGSQPRREGEERAMMGKSEEY